MYDKSRPIYERNCETSSGHPFGGGLACDYTDHPAVPDPADLSVGIRIYDDWLWRGPEGVVLPFAFSDSPRTMLPDGRSEPYGGYGWQHWTDESGNRNRFHSGTDHPQSNGTPIRATLPGTVICADNTGASGYGKGISVFHGTVWRCGSKYNLYTLYAHCSEVAASLLEVVQAGEVIAYVGSTGNSTGPHLHFEYKIILGQSEVSQYDHQTRLAESIGESLKHWGGHTLNPRLFDTRECEI